MTTLTSTLPDSIGRVEAELQSRRRRLHFISGLSQGKIPIPFSDDIVRKWMFKGGFRVDSFVDLYNTPMKYLDSLNVKALEREIGDMSKALEVLQKQDKQPTQSSGGRKRSVSEDVSKSRIVPQTPDAALQPSPILRPAKAYLKSPKLTAGDAEDDAIDEAFEKNFFL
eukprot:g12325.t1